MEEHIERLFDLLETKAFEALNAEERAFVLQHITEEEYAAQRKVIGATTELTYDIPEPLPIAVPVKQTFLTKSIPMYQVLIGAACLLVGIFVFRNGSDAKIGFDLIDEPIAFSVSQNPQVIQVVHDTVVQRIPGVQLPGRIIRDTLTVVETVFMNRNESRMLDATVPSLTVELNKALLESKSLSAKEDNSIGLLPKMSDFGTMK